MNPLVVVAGALMVGWLVIWGMLQQHMRRQGKLAKKIEELESKHTR